LNKTLIKFMAAFGLLAVLLIVLAVNYVPRTSALPSADENRANVAKYAASDYFERHPSVVDRPSNYLLGSDYIERHPSAVDRPSNYLLGSDYIERHPSAVDRPSYYYSGSDWIERHPSQPAR